MKDTYNILQQAITQYEKGNFQEAIKIAGEASADKEYAFTYNELTAHCYYGLAQYGNSIWFYKKALALDASNIEIEARLAAAFDLSGEPKKAAPLFKKLYKAHPGNARFAYKLGYHLLGQQKHKQALPLFREAYDLQTNIHPDIHFLMGVCYHNMKEWENALTFLEAQSGFKDVIADCYHLMGNCYRNLHQDDKAIIAYSQAIWLNENHDDAYWQRFLTKKGNGDYDGAEADIRRVLEINPNRFKVNSEEGKPLHIIEININRSNGNVDFLVSKTE